MNLLRIGALSAVALVTASSAFAQASTYVAAPANANAIAALDMGGAPLGPIASNAPYFVANQVSSIDVVGPWVAGADVLSDFLNSFGQSLTVTNGQLRVSVLGNPLDDPGPGAGFDITLATLVDEFGLFFTDQAGFAYTVEFFNGPTSVGFLNEIYALSYPPIYLRAGAQFDRLEIRFPNGAGGVGLDNLTLGVGPGPDPVPDNCLETLFDGRFGGVAVTSTVSAAYFDLEVLQAGAANEVFISCIADGSGLPIGLNIYTTPGTRIGKEGDPSQWTLAAQGDGATVAQNLWARTEVVLQAPWNLPAGTYGVAFEIENAFMIFTGDDGLNNNHTSGDGLMSFFNPSFEDVAFAGDMASTADPGVLNVRICREPGTPIGSAFCTPNANSTGAPGLMTAIGSTAVADNNLTLQIRDLPGSQFGIVVVSDVLGNPVTPPNSQGILCLSGLIGRYSLPGEIFQVDANGATNYGIDITAIRRPATNVAAAPGDTWFFQAWHRDNIGMGPTSNFTSGVQVTFN